MAAWYVRRGEKVVGPVEVAKLKELVAAGKLLPTDLLANDVAGPWKEAVSTTLFTTDAVHTPPATEDSTESRATALVAKVDQLPAVPESTTGKTAMAIRVGGIVISTIGRGALSAISALSRSLSSRSQRKHELKLAKIQAQALAESHRPPATRQGSAAPPAAAPVATSITFAPQIVQSTVVKAVSRSTGGYGCSGCGVVLLLVLLGVLALALLPGSQNQTTRNAGTSFVDADSNEIDPEPGAAENTRVAQVAEQKRLAAIEDAKFRTWTSASGSHATEAKIVSYANGVVTLENREGKRTKVEVDKLRDSDREFIEKWRRDR